MKKTTFILLIISILAFSSCTKVEKTYHPNGALKSEISYCWNKEHGITRYYHNNGRKELEVTMKHGKREGKLMRWYNGGQIESISYYKNDSLNGVQTNFDRMGRKMTAITYKNGKKHGSYTSWHDGEIVKEQGFFADDLYDGDWEYFDKRGFPVGEAHYERGSGTLTGYDPHGNILRTTSYQNNMKNGEQIDYLPNGEIAKKTIFKDDRIVSVENFVEEPDNQ